MKFSRFVIAVVFIVAGGEILAQGAPISGSGSAGIAFGSSPMTGGETTGTLTVDVTGVTGQGNGGSTPVVLGGYQIAVTFDHSRFNVVGVSGGTSSGFTSVPTHTTLDSANASGEIMLSASHTNATSPTGNVLVAQIHFKALAVGLVNVTVTPVSLSTAFQPPSFGPAAIPGSGSSTVVTVEPPPSPPGAFSYVGPADGALELGLPVILSWNPSVGASSYRVYFGESDNPPEYVSTAETSFEPQVTTGTTYYWKVEASNSAGSYPGPVWSFSTDGPYCPLPGTPTVQVPTAVASGAPYTVAWSEVPAANEYQLEESTTVDFAGAQQFTVPGTTKSRTFSHESTVKTRYYYRVRARRTANGCDVKGDFSPGATVLVDPGLVPPPPPPDPEPESTTNIVPVVGSLPGGFGSYFRTTIQLHNPTDTVQTGKLIFRPREGGEVSLPYSLAPRQTLRYQDVVEAVGRTGLGSLDVKPESGGFPIVVSRIFNDGGDAGTSGMMMDQIDPRDALQSGQTGIIVGPGDTEQARLNIGVRTLDEPAMVSFVVRTADGTPVGSGSRELGANDFIQESATEFLGTEIGEDAVIEFTVSTAAIIYGTVTDTTTNDPSYQVARRIVRRDQ